ncbi:MAG: hypothetical protein ACAI35_23120 [Candidatus Methylacidiphilales bacterium]|nr:hypothetical protein [Candidatus Methylacidiphilales bacterium]
MDDPRFPDSNDPSSDGAPRRPRGIGGTTTTAIAAAFILYILSIGPVAAFYQSNPHLSDTWHSNALRTCYAPIIYLCNAIVPMRNLLVSYLELCDSLFFTKGRLVGCSVPRVAAPTSATSKAPAYSPSSSGSASPAAAPSTNAAPLSPAETASEK